LSRDHIARCQLATCIGIALFWVAFFLGGEPNPRYPSHWLAFERSFPLADGFLCVCLALAYAKRNTPAWGKVSLIGAGAMVFLGLVDFSYNAANGIYGIGWIEGPLNLAINLWCMGLGAYVISHADS
jgi:hypothetical protein